MGKRLKDLDLGTSGPSPVDDLALIRKRGQQLYEEVLAMLESGQYDFTWGFLKDLSLTLEQTGVATAAQVEAVRNIKAGKDRHDRQAEGWERHERRTGRRYEGFGDSKRF